MTVRTGPPRGNGELSRRNNLSIVLGLVHRHGNQTRAELTRATGLNRSTIAALVGELSDLGLVYEKSAESGSVGRPSPRVHANEKAVALTINPDTDAITIGLVGLGGQVHKRVRYPTGSTPTASQAVKIIAAVVDGMSSELADQFTVLGAGLAVPALVNTSDGVVAWAPHLGWRSEPFAAAITEAIGYPAVAANDAYVGTIAESRYGAGAGIADLVYLNGSASGIGGGVLVAGHPLRGASGYAGELGHTVVNPTGAQCHCGRRGCLETEVSRTALLDALGLDAGAADQLDQHLQASTDPRVRAEVERQIGWLATAMIDFTHIFDPTMIILGGFLGSLRLAARELLDRSVQGHGLSNHGPAVQIEHARLGPALLTIGAAELVFAPVLADPQVARSLSLSKGAVTVESAG